MTESMYRVTRPEKYPAGPGKNDPSSRNGIYQKATSAADALSKVRGRKLDPALGLYECLTIQDWSDGPDHGKTLDVDGNPIAGPFFS